MDTLRPMLWLAFAFVLFLLWQDWQEQHAPLPPMTEVVSVPTTRATAPTVASPATGGVATSANAPIAATTAPDAPMSAAPAAAGTTPVPAPVALQGERIRVHTDVLDVELDTLGGDLMRAELLDYAVHKDQAPRVRLLDADGATRAVARTGLRGADGSLLDHRTLWTTAARDLSMAAGQESISVLFEAPLADGAVAQKEYTFRRGDYAIEVALRVRGGTAPWVGDAYVQLEKHQVPVERSFFSTEGYSYEGVAYHDGAKYQKVAPEDLDEQAFELAVAGGWIANLQHHFLAGAVPRGPGSNTYYARALGSMDYVAGFVMPAQTVAAGGAGEFNATLWVGPKLQERLEQVAPGLELSTDYGMFTIFAKPLFWVVAKLYWLFGNWGWAIIGLTVLIKVLFYKLAETSGRSMAKMRTVAPKLEQLKERYKDDRMKLNEAMLELYRKEKINPVSGCLPVLIQLPVFIALYWVLLESVEMRQAPWILWIQDLSAKDPWFVLPLLMGAAMWAQMKLNPPPPDPVQAKVMMMMPVMFTGMSMFFPAGLTLYWLVNTALSVAQQWQINKVVEAEAAARRS